MSPEQTIRLNALTIDLEEWYHGLTRTNPRRDLWPTLTPRAEVATSFLLDLLAEAGVRATFFVLGDLAQHTPDLIRRIAEAGHELGSHGYYHRPVWRLTPDEFRLDLAQTRQAIGEAVAADGGTSTPNLSLAGFRAPYFSIDRRSPWAFEILAEAGYRYDSSIFPMRTILYGEPNAVRSPYEPLGDGRLVEYPVAVAQVGKLKLPVGGGFYLRMLPYPLVQWGIRRLNQQGLPAVLYMHPWELDLHQPRIAVSPRERITHYGGRGALAAKLHRLLKDFHLAPLSEVHQAWLSSYC